MAIAFDNATVSNGSTSALTFNHTIGANGTNRIVFVGGTIDGSKTITGATYGGTSMTLIDSQPSSTTTDYLFYLLNPPTGTSSVVLTGSGTAFIYGGAVSYSGVKQSGQPDNKAKTSTTSGTSLTNSLTTVADNCWTVMSFGNAASGVTAGTGETSRLSSNGQFMMADSAGPISPAGSYSMTTTYDSSGGNQIGTVMASFAPYVAPTNIKSINGLAYASIKNVNGLATASMKNFNGLS